ncbi:Ribosomal protein S23/S29 mitochondrial [Penicillium alfredii]|uniref:Small ribosomal subunit protein mS29 n=1 Tax=Penicillium alfredii TaxID=1506179 RepID=A0A9W9K3T8_9EURO|nr:Ribosomal protein S23/S29 mitochondrial [Penicillium alfredii]KAJ5092054.1 Ribosomal protein S23/S29 mitochondrial [Penicillium alfredii]
MVSSWCWSCLSRLRPTPRALPPPSAAPRITSAPFHSTAIQLAQPAKKKGPSLTTAKHRQGHQVRRKNKKPVENPVRPPAAGERKALRKRIVLSNPNALEVKGMQDLSPGTMIDGRLRGTVLGLPVPLLDQLRAVQAFKPKQGWSIFRRPGTIMRHDTIEMGRLFEKISADGEGAQKGQVVKKIISGAKGTGKTVHLLQAMTMAFLKKWVVIAVPDAHELVAGVSGYAPIEGTNPTQYTQPAATSALLARTVEANREVLSNLQVSQQHPALTALKPSSTLEELASLGFQDPAIAWPVFQALWTELTATAAAPGMEKNFQPRPPMLVTVDGLAHWMTDSAYRTADFSLVHSHNLIFVKHFLSLLQPGQSPLKNGGLLLYATSTSNNPSVYGLNLGLEQLAARQAGISPSSPEYPQPFAFSGVDPRVMDLFKPAETSSAKEGPLEVQTLGGLTRDETRGYMEYFAQSGLVRQVIDDHWVSDKWSLSGGGIIGELEKLGRRVQNVQTATN